MKFPVPEAKPTWEGLSALTFAPQQLPIEEFPNRDDRDRLPLPLATQISNPGSRIYWGQISEGVTTGSADEKHLFLLSCIKNNRNQMPPPIQLAGTPDGRTYRQRKGASLDRMAREGDVIKEPQEGMWKVALLLLFSSRPSLSLTSKQRRNGSVNWQGAVGPNQQSVKQYELLLLYYFYIIIIMRHFWFYFYILCGQSWDLSVNYFGWIYEKTLLTLDFFLVKIHLS